MRNFYERKTSSLKLYTNVDKIAWLIDFFGKK